MRTFEVQRMTVQTVQVECVTESEAVVLAQLQFERRYGHDRRQSLEVREVHPRPKGVSEGMGMTTGPDTEAEPPRRIG